MEILTAGAEVGTGQTLVRKARAVCAAADGADDGRDAGLLHGLLGMGDEEHASGELFLHVVVAVTDGQLRGACAVCFVDLLRKLLHELLAALELLAVVVADDIAQARLLHVAGDVAQVEEALIALGVGGRFVRRKHGVKLHADEHGADHLVLGAAGVNAPAVDDELCGGGVEILIFQLAQRAAVNGVGVLRAEALDVEQVRAAADLLVGRKADADDAVRHIGVQQHICRRQNFRHARLVVCAEKRGAVGDDQVLADVAAQGREILRGQEDALFLVQNDVAAVIDVGDAGLDVLAVGVGRGVHVGDQAEDGGLRLAVCRNGAVDIAVLVHVCVGDAKLLHLAHQLRAEHPLARCGGAGTGAFIRGRLIGDKLQKPFNNRHDNAPSYDCGASSISHFCKNGRGTLRKTAHLSGGCRPCRRSFAVRARSG